MQQFNQVQRLTAIKHNNQSQESPRQRAHGKSQEKPQTTIIEV